MLNLAKENPQFTAIFDQIFHLVPCVQSSIYLLDGPDLRYVASRGLLPPEQITKLNFPLDGTGGAKVAMDEDRPVLLADVKGEEELALIFQESAKMAPENTFDFIGSWIGLPIHIDGKVEALLDVCHPERNFYTMEHVEALFAWLKQVESTIQNAILLADLSQRSAELEILNNIQQAISSRLDLNDVLQIVADHALRLTSARQIVIFVGDQSGMLTAQSCAGNPLSVIQPGFQLSIQSTLVNYALRQDQAMRILNVNRDERIDSKEADRLGIFSLLVIPLKTTIQPNGIVMAIGNTFGAFGPNDERAVATLAASAAIGIDNAQLYQRERERRLMAESVQHIQSLLNSSQPLENTLTTVLAITTRILHADAGAIQLVGAQPQILGLNISTYQSLRNFIENGNHQPVQTASSTSPYFSFPSDSTWFPVSFDQLFPLIDLPQESDSQDQPFSAAMHIIFSARPSTLGSMDLFWQTPPRLSEEENQIVETITRYITLTINRDQLKRKEEELVRLQERQRIAQSLHDTVTQLLFRTGLEAKWCLQQQNMGAEVLTRLETMQHLITRISYEIRSAIFALNQQEIREGHSLIDLLQAQITDFQRECGIIATLVTQNDLGELPFPMVEAIYRLVREALNNIYKHANATATFVSLKRDGDNIVVTIQDDGLGLPAGQPVDTLESNLHFGINSMRQLVAPFGGQLSIQNNDEQGVIVKAIFSIDRSTFI